MQLDSFDRKEILEAVTANGELLQFVPAELKRDKEIVLAAVTHPAGRSGKTLSYASKSMKRDREVVLRAVTYDLSGSALKHASSSLRKDREIVKAAIASGLRHGTAILWADPCFLDDKKMLLFALARTKTEEGATKIWQKIHNNLKSDRDFLISALMRNEHLYPLLSSALNSDIRRTSRVTFNINIPTISLFNLSSPNYYELHEIKPGLLEFRCRVSMGLAGIEGQLDLWAPGEFDDAGAYRDNYLSFMTIPAEEGFPEGKQNPRICIFMGRNYSDEHALTIVTNIDLLDDEYDDEPTEDIDWEILFRCLKNLEKVFKRHFNAKFIFGL